MKGKKEGHMFRCVHDAVFDLSSGSGDRLDADVFSCDVPRTDTKLDEREKRQRESFYCCWPKKPGPLFHCWLDLSSLFIMACMSHVLAIGEGRHIENTRGGQIIDQSCLRHSQGINSYKYHFSFKIKRI